MRKHPPGKRKLFLVIWSCLTNLFCLHHRNHWVLETEIISLIWRYSRGLYAIVTQLILLHFILILEVHQPYWGRLSGSPSTGGAGCGWVRRWPQVNRVGTGWEAEEWLVYSHTGRENRKRKLQSHLKENREEENCFRINMFGYDSHRDHKILCVRTLFLQTQLLTVRME